MWMRVGIISVLVGAGAACLAVALSSLDEGSWLQALLIEVGIGAILLGAFDWLIELVVSAFQREEQWQRHWFDGLAVAVALARRFSLLEYQAIREGLDLLTEARSAQGVRAKSALLLEVADNVQQMPGRLPIDESPGFAEDMADQEAMLRAAIDASNDHDLADDEHVYLATTLNVRFSTPTPPSTPRDFHPQADEWAHQILAARPKAWWQRIFATRSMTLRDPLSSMTEITAFDRAPAADFPPMLLDTKRADIE
jgi:hypothetical protein